MQLSDWWIHAYCLIANASAIFGCVRLFAERRRRIRVWPQSTARGIQKPVSPIVLAVLWCGTPIGLHSAAWSRRTHFSSQQTRRGEFLEFECLRRHIWTFRTTVQKYTEELDFYVNRYGLWKKIHTVYGHPRKVRINHLKCESPRGNAFWGFSSQL